MIKKFKITKLFGFRNVNIPFDENVKILIGENGLGKTTILNSLYYILSEKYNKLYSVDFERVELQFYSGDKIQFTKRELGSYLGFSDVNDSIRMPKQILEKLPLAEIASVLEEESDFFEEDRELIRYLKNRKIPRWAPLQVMAKEVKYLIQEPILMKFIGWSEILKSNGVNLLYFPTYRRVEEDLNNLGKFRRRYFDPDFEEEFIDEIEEDFQVNDDTLIHFGMEDVENRINNVKNFINVSTIEGFSKVTGKILSQLLKGFPEIQQEEISDLDIETAKIVLHRVGGSLSEGDRERILQLLDHPDELRKKKELTYFLFNLIEIYDQHKHVDDAIKRFRDVCNGYLEDKKFVYDESTVDIDIYRKGSPDKVELNKLSSGEKQIVSLFSKIYLEFSKSYIVLFDEPELSLSIEWQKKLLPDIVNSDKCDFLLTVTHSPFIFKNDLDRFAIGMNAYLK